MIALILALALPHALATGLKMKGLEVPPITQVGGKVTLSCDFALGSANLYSVKWYKDEAEFFRFMPQASPQTQIFPLTGIYLDESISDLHRVSLMDLSVNSSGLYRCEVSTEGPNFETVMASANMSVVEFPDRPPEIVVGKSYFNLEEEIKANCSSGKSFPAPRLTWYINGVQANESYTLFEKVQEEEKGIFRAYSGIRIPPGGVSPGRLQLSCLSSFKGSDTPAKSTATLSLHPPLTNLRLDQEPPRQSQAQGLNGFTPKKLAFLTISLFISCSFM